MGGFGAMSYAAQHPDLFAAAGSFSGAIDTDYRYPYANEVLSNASPFTVDLPRRCIWGDPYSQELHWRAADPTYLAGNLRGVSLYIASGNGKPGPLDDPGSPSIYLHQNLERFVSPMSHSMDDALTADAVPHVDDFYGNGTHDWPYWMRDLGHFLPQMDSATKRARSSHRPAHFDYRTTAAQFSVWGWSFAGTRSAPEFTYLSDVSPRGFRVSGSGTLSVVTAPVYRPHAAATVTIGATSRSVVADAAGRLTFTVDLGPAHTTQQTKFGPDAGNSWAHRTVTITES
jgi:hypothetical protein